MKCHAEGQNTAPQLRMEARDLVFQESDDLLNELHVSDMKNFSNHFNSVVLTCRYGSKICRHNGKQ